MSDIFANVYGVELLCTHQPTISKAALLDSLSRYCPGVEPLGDSESSPFGFVQTAHCLRFADGDAPAQILVMETDKAMPLEQLEPGLQQAWDFRGARGAVAGCTATVIVTDMMASGLGHRERIDVFQRSLRGVLECVPCAAIRWRPSERIVDPAVWMDRYDAGDDAMLFMSGAMSVRMFNVADADAPRGEYVMDTLGLGALGLPDIQCHFLELEPGDVAQVLYNIAWYIFSNGDVIEDGHTVEGIEPGSKWRCRHEDSLVGPDRVVLDLEPGAPFAAGR